MITATDTNVLSDVFREDPIYYEGSSEALRRCLREGALIACEAVWAETIAAFEVSQDAIDALKQLPVRFTLMTEPASESAGAAWRLYRKAGGPRTRVIADFLIGAHALETADRLLTRDRGFYRTYFKELQVLDPSGSS